MSALLARIKVVLTALPTWLITAAAVITFAVPLLAEQLPQYADGITRWGVSIAAWLAAAVAIIRKVSPVPDAQVGLLPKAGS